MNKYIVWNYEGEPKLSFVLSESAPYGVLKFSPNTKVYILLSSNVLMRKFCGTAPVSKKKRL